MKCGNPYNVVHTTEWRSEERAKDGLDQWSVETHWLCIKVDVRHCIQKACKQVYRLQWNLLMDTSVRTRIFIPKLVISIPFDLCNQATSQLRTADVSPKGVLGEVRKMLEHNNKENLCSSTFLFVHDSVVNTCLPCKTKDIQAPCSFPAQ
jgi:hypothetical protein